MGRLVALLCLLSACGTNALRVTGTPQLHGVRVLLTVRHPPNSRAATTARSLSRAASRNALSTAAATAARIRSSNSILAKSTASCTSEELRQEEFHTRGIDGQI